MKSLCRERMPVYLGTRSFPASDTCTMSSFPIPNWIRCVVPKRVRSSTRRLHPSTQTVHRPASLERRQCVWDLHRTQTLNQPDHACEVSTSPRHSPCQPGRSTEQLPDARVIPYTLASQTHGLDVKCGWRAAHQHAQRRR